MVKQLRLGLGDGGNITGTNPPGAKAKGPPRDMPTLSWMLKTGQLDPDDLGHNVGLKHMRPQSALAGMRAAGKAPTMASGLDGASLQPSRPSGASLGNMLVPPGTARPYTPGTTGGSATGSRPARPQSAPHMRGGGSPAGNASASFSAAANVQGLGRNMARMNTAMAKADIAAVRALS